ncbi:MAG: ABC transporter permease [Clostridiales bacterium]|nr:ABC transporter permease [Clostridiales bacterium]
MRPFSAFTYFRNNKLRVLVLILMMSFITVCFIGGMYVDNPGETFRVRLEGPNRYLVFSTRGSSNEAIEQYRKLQEELPSMLPEEAQEVIYLNRVYADYDCIMMFNCTCEFLVFQYEEDFELFKERTGLVPDDIHLHDGEVVMTELLANNKGLKVGDPVGTMGQYKLTSTMDGKGMWALGVLDAGGTGETMILSSDGNCDKKLSDDLDKLGREITKKYPLVYAVTNSLDLEDVESQIGFMYAIFGAVVVLVVIVLLVTINAAYTAAYDKRKHEFAIYKALGFTKGQIFRKVAGEVLWMNLAAMIFGAILNCGTILVLNQVFWSSGHHFYRVSKTGVIGTIIAEVLVITTIILLNWKKVRKCEVTED